MKATKRVSFPDNSPAAKASRIIRAAAHSTTSPRFRNEVVHRNEPGQPTGYRYQDWRNW